MRSWLRDLGDATFETFHDDAPDAGTPFSAGLAALAVGGGGLDVEGSGRRLDQVSVNPLAKFEAT